MKKLLTVLFIFLTIISCKKDDEVLQEETGILENYVLLNFKIPESITNSNIEIIADGSNYETTDDGNYYVPKNSKVVYAVNKATDKIIYFTYPTSFNVSGRNSVSNNGNEIILNARETAISLGVQYLAVNDYIPYYDYATTILSVKDFIVNSSPFEDLVQEIQDRIENNIEDVISYTYLQKYLDMIDDWEECGSDIYEVINQVPVSDPNGVNGNPSTTEPYFPITTSSSNGTIRVGINSSTFNTTTNKWDVNLTVYNSAPLFLGAKVGSKTNGVYNYEPNPVKNLLKPYNTSQLNKSFTDCSTFTNWLGGVKSLSKGDIPSFLANTTFHTENTFDVSFDNSNHHLFVYSPQESKDLMIINSLQLVIKSMGVLNTLIGSNSDDNNVVDKKILNIYNKFLEKALLDGNINSTFSSLSSQFTKPNLKAFLIAILDEFQDFIVDAESDAITKQLFKDIVQNKLESAYSNFDVSNALVEVKNVKKWVNTSEKILDVYMAVTSWKNYNEGVAFECILPNSNTLPIISTSPITQITATTATTGGNITDDGGSEVTARGVCWSTNPNPTTADNTTNDGTGTGSFTSFLNGLTENTTYYIRSYATNSEGTTYGNEEDFTTANCNGGIFNGSVVLTTQQEVNDFGLNCYSEIMGNINIGGAASDINSLLPLSSINIINGQLRILNCENLLNLDGLSLSYVSYLDISNNNNLININSLSSITSSISNTIIIINNNSLLNVNGLTNVSGDIVFLRITDNDNISNIDGVSSITSVEYLQIKNNPLLENINGLSNITSIASLNNNYGLWIYENNTLNNLNGLSNLTYTANLYIHNNNNLNDFCGLETLINSNGVLGNYTVNNNLYNPTQQDIIDGNCNQ